MEAEWFLIDCAEDGSVSLIPSEDVIYDAKSVKVSDEVNFMFNEKQYSGVILGFGGEGDYKQLKIQRDGIIKERKLAAKRAASFHEGDRRKASIKGRQFIQEVLGKGRKGRATTKDGDLLKGDLPNVESSLLSECPKSLTSGCVNNVDIPIEPKTGNGNLSPAESGETFTLTITKDLKKARKEDMKFLQSAHKATLSSAASRKDYDQDEKMAEESENKRDILDMSDHSQSSDKEHEPAADQEDSSVSEKVEKSSDDDKEEKSSDDDKEEKSSDDEKEEKSSDDEKEEKSSDDETEEKSSDDETEEKSSDDEKEEKSSDDEALKNQNSTSLSINRKKVSMPKKTGKEGAVPKKSRKEGAVPKKSEKEAVPKKSEKEAVPKKSEKEAVPKKSEKEALPKKSEKEAVPKKSEKEAVPKKSEKEAAPKKSEKGALPKKSQKEAVPKKSEKKEAVAKKGEEKPKHCRAVLQELDSEEDENSNMFNFSPDSPDVNVTEIPFVCISEEMLAKAKACDSATTLARTLMRGVFPVKALSTHSLGGKKAYGLGSDGPDRPSLDADAVKAILDYTMTRQKRKGWKPVMARSVAKSSLRVLLVETRRKTKKCKAL